MFKPIITKLMRIALLCFFLLLFVIPALSQTSNRDELPLPVLRQQLATAGNDSNKVQIQLALGHLMLLKPDREKKDNDSASSFAKQSSALSQKLNYHFGIINGMLLNAEIANQQGNLKQSLIWAQKALAFSQKNHNTDGQARSYIQIAQYYQVSTPAGLNNRIIYNNKAISLFRKDHNLKWLAFMLTTNAELLFLSERNTEALKSLFEALNLGKAVSRRTVEGIYWQIGRTSTKLSDYPNALKYNLLALKTAKEVNDTTLQLCSINHVIAATYIKLQDYNRAIPYSIEALRIARRYRNRDYINTVSSALALEYTHTNKLAKALSLLNEMKSHAQSDLDKLTVSVDFLNNLTFVKHFTAAERYAREVKVLLPRIPDHNVTDLIAAYNVLAAYYLETKQVALADHYAALHASMVRKQNYVAGIRTAESRYYKLDSLKGNLKSAIVHYLKAQRIKDSVDNLAKAYQISLLHIENETAEKNKHISMLTREAQLREIKLIRYRLIQNFAIGGCLLLLIITGLIYSRYRLKQRSNALLRKQKLQIDEKNTALQHLVTDKNQLLDDKDKLLLEKDLLLKEVNHRVKNNLQIVMNLLHSQSFYISNEDAQQAILESQNRVQSIALIHDQLYKTEHNTEINLSSYIEELINSLNSSLNKRNNAIAIKWDIDNISLDVSQTIPLGIILNEMVTNALKYAFPIHQTGTISILLKQTDMSIEMQISDNGIGLPPDFSIEQTNTLGLTLLKGLTGQLNGTYIVENKSGLSITVKFPIDLSIMQEPMLNI
jgi:two-component sensor histidine kinase